MDSNVMPHSTVKIVKQKRHLFCDGVRYRLCRIWLNHATDSRFKWTEINCFRLERARPNCNVCAHEMGIHMCGPMQRQQKKKSNDISNFPIQPWSGSNRLRKHHQPIDKGKIDGIFETNPMWLKSIARENSISFSISLTHFMCVYIFRIAVSWFWFPFFLLSDIESSVKCLKFTKCVRAEQSMCCYFFSIVFFVVVGFYLSQLPLIWCRENNVQQTVGKSDLHPTDLFCCRCFAHHYTSLDCNSRLSALIMRRHIRYIQFILTTIYCRGTQYRSLTPAFSKPVVFWEISISTPPADYQLATNSKHLN